MLKLIVLISQFIISFVSVKCYTRISF